MRATETRHAAARRQQRGIPPFVVALLMDEGAQARHGGADVFFADKRARRRIRALLGERLYAAAEEYLDAYVVGADDGRVVTAGWRLDRIRRA